jgi:hypothetical protein
MISDIERSKSICLFKRIFLTKCFILESTERCTDLHLHLHLESFISEIKLVLHNVL